MCTVFQVCFVFCLVRRSRKYPETNPLTNIRENKRKHTAFVTWILKKLLPLLQWNVYVSQWLSTMTWPGQTGLTNEFTSLPWPDQNSKNVLQNKVIFFSTNLKLKKKRNKKRVSFSIYRPKIKPWRL